MAILEFQSGGALWGQRKSRGPTWMSILHGHFLY